MSSLFRILDVSKRLFSGEPVSIRPLALEYNCDAHTIKRDIQYIRDVFGDIVKYERGQNVYVLKEKEQFLTVGEVFMLILMLYNSRSLNKKESKEIAKRLIDRFSEEERMKFNTFFRSFDYYYTEVTEIYLQERIQMLFYSVVEQRRVTFRYPHANTGVWHERKVDPVTLTFYKGAFYLLAKREDQILRHYRIDRMKGLRSLQETFYVDQGVDFFQVGEYHNLAFNMFSGEEKVIRLKIPLNVEEYLRRECPDVEIIVPRVDNDRMIVQVKTLGYQGILFWIFSQQEWIEVLAPEELRDIMRNKIERMRGLYEK